MKQSIYIALVVLIGMVGCTFLEGYTFEDGLSMVEAIDEEHGTSMYKEQLHKVMLNDWDVEEMLDDLNAIEQKLKFMKKTDDVKALSLLIEFRKTMLDAELDMIKVRQIGSKGSLMTPFTCKDKPYIYNASMIMKDAVYKGADALTTFDKLTGFAVASEHLDRDKIDFDESDIEHLLSLANRGRGVGKEGGFCDDQEERKAREDANKTNEQ